MADGTDRQKGICPAGFCDSSILAPEEMESFDAMTEEEYQKWGLETAPKCQGRVSSKIPVRNNRAPSNRRPSPKKYRAPMESKIPTNTIRCAVPVSSRTDRQSVPIGEATSRGSKIPIQKTKEKVKYATRHCRQNYFLMEPNIPEPQNTKPSQPSKGEPSRQSQQPQTSLLPPVTKQAIAAKPKDELKDELKQKPKLCRENYFRIEPPPMPKPQKQQPLKFSRIAGSSRSKQGNLTKSSKSSLPKLKPCPPTQDTAQAYEQFVTPAPEFLPIANCADYDEEVDFDDPPPQLLPEVCVCGPDDEYNLQWREDQLAKLPKGEGAGPQSGYMETTDPNILAMCRGINLRYKSPEIKKVKRKLQYYNCPGP